MTDQSSTAQSQVAPVIDRSSLVHAATLRETVWSPACIDGVGWVWPLARAADQVTCTRCREWLSLGGREPCGCNGTPHFLSSKCPLSPARYASEPDGLDGY